VPGAVTVTVGGGGGGGVNINTAGSNGGNSIFSSLTAIGGGGGGGDAGSLNGQNGGSGGGSGAEGNTIGTAGTGTTGQGNNGGTASITGGGFGGGGGGGAGAIGGNGTGSTGGQGGNGLPYSISGSSVYYAGGGGGGVFNANGTPGTGGLGGGGNGAGSGSGQNGTVNTGGGGGAGGTKADGVLSNGGSGIVIVRYPLPVRLTGTPLFTQLSTSATSSAVGAFSLRAVNGTSAKAVQVRPVAAFPPAAMTSNGPQTLPGYAFGGGGSYTASASSQLPGYGDTTHAFRAFDSDPTNAATWHSEIVYDASGNYTGAVSTAGYSGEWLQIQMPSTTLYSYSMITRQYYDLRSPNIFYILGSNNGTDWILVDSQSGITGWTWPTRKTFIIASPVSTSFIYFRLVINKTNGPNSVQISSFILNGTLSGSSADFYADRLGNLLTAPVTGQSLANWLGGATGYVTKWYNQIQPGQDVSATVAANQPTIDPVNKTIVFNGTNQSFSNTATTGGLLAASAGTGTKYTYVARFTPTATFRSVVEHNSVGFTGSNRSALLIYGTSYGFNGEGNDTFNTLAPVTLGTAYSAVMRVDNTLAGYTANGNKNIRLRSNGTDYSAATGNYAILNLNNYWFTIGRKGSNNSEFFNGSMKSVMVFKDAISDADTAVLDAWQQSL
jgi:hypothetical protein